MDYFHFLQRTYTTVKRNQTKILDIVRKVTLKATYTLSGYERTLSNNFLNILGLEIGKTFKNTQLREPIASDLLHERWSFFGIDNYTVHQNIFL